MEDFFEKLIAWSIAASVLIIVVGLPLVAAFWVVKELIIQGAGLYFLFGGE